VLYPPSYVGVRVNLQAILRTDEMFPVLLGALARVRNVTLASGPVVDTPALIQSRIVCVVVVLGG
jgi:hypothetical protein